MNTLNKTNKFKLTYACPECGKHIEFDIDFNINISNTEEIPSDLEIEFIDRRIYNLKDQDILFINCPFCKKDTMNKIDSRALKLYEAFVKKGYTFSTKNFIPFSIEKDTLVREDYPNDQSNYIPIYEIIIEINTIFDNIFYRFFEQEKWQESFKLLNQENSSYLFGEIFQRFNDKFDYESNLETILDDISYDIANYHHIFFKLFDFPENFNTYMSYYTVDSGDDNEYEITIYADNIDNLFKWCESLPNLRDVNEVINLIRKYYTLS